MGTLNRDASEFIIWMLWKKLQLAAGRTAA
jgi:hypothetical protein